MDKRLLLAVILLCCAAIACGDDVGGTAVPAVLCTVSDKVYTPETTEFIPVPQNTSPGVPLPSAGGYRLLPHTTPESYVLILQCGDRENKLKVSQEMYGCYSIGDSFPGDGCKEVPSE